MMSLPPRGSTEAVLRWPGRNTSYECGFDILSLRAQQVSQAEIQLVVDPVDQQSPGPGQVHTQGRKGEESDRPKENGRLWGVEVRGQADNSGLGVRSLGFVNKVIF